MRPVKGGAPHSLPSDIILPVTLGHCLWQMFERPTLENILQVCWAFSHFRGMFTFSGSCLSCTQTDMGGLELKRVMCMKKPVPGMFCLCSLCVSCQRLRCNTYSPQLRGCWVSTQQGLAGLLQLLLPGDSHHLFICSPHPKALGGYLVGWLVG